MKATGRKPSRRYSREQTQEDRSEGQLKERLAEVGWPCDRLGRDLGEDLHVRIYDDGASTGLAFHVQLKSAASAEPLKRKKAPALVYRLEVKDLLHWEVSATLVVVLVVWDVEKRTGWWRPIPEIIKDLDATGTGWRKQKTVAVSVPLANGTDTAGLTRLRWQIADHSLPIVPKPQRMDFSLIFDKTDEGEAAFRDFKRAIELDERLILEGEFAPKIEYPEWYRRLYGHAPIIQLNKFEKGTSLLSKETVAVRIEVDSPEGHGEYSYVELRPVVQGSKRLVLTNEHQSLPLVFRFKLDLHEKSLKFSFKQKRSGRTVYEARDAVMFLVAATTSGAVGRVTDHRNGHSLLTFRSLKTPAGHDLQGMRRERDVLDKLCYIQQRVTDVGSFQLEGVDVFSPVEVSCIDSLFEICRSGRIETTMSISFEIPPGMAGPSVFTVTYRDGSVSLLNLNIPLGDMRVTVLDSARATNAVRVAKAEADATGKPAVVSLEDLRVVQEYLAWLPGKLPWVAMYEALERLAEVTGQYDGYFTRADARAAGATDAIFDALVGEHKIEQVVADVFHLVYFPRFDQEDLIALWLKTDRQGVLSHETALLLHELSDVLPRRRHVTVPPGWDPGDRKLGENVVLYHAAVGPDELRWLGPVPYTAPLRTLRDCIASHLSPDLIEQAITDGLGRGIFTEAELAPLARRGAA